MKDARSLGDSKGALATLVLGLLVACGTPPEENARPTSRPTTRPAAAAASPTDEVQGTDEALRFADRIRGYAGGPGAWEQVENVVFTFAGRRRLYWDRVAEKVRIEREQDGVVLFYDIARDEAQVLAGEPRGDARDLAKGIWINDTYWLFVALKVKDPGVLLSVDPPEAGDPAGSARIRLRFGSVGLTPDNEYVLHIDKATGRIQRWDYLRDAEATPLSWKFEDYRDLGPLRLSLSRPKVGGEGGIELGDVGINVDPPEEVWSAKNLLLRELK